MDLSKVRDLIEKLPLTLILFLYLAYLGFDYYTFIADSASALNEKKSAINNLKVETGKLDKKYKELSQFVKNLDNKKAQVRELTQELEQTKGVVPEILDIPNIMKVTITEAKKAGLIILSLRPGGMTDRDYYSEQAFTLTYRGVYSQLLIFLERMSNINQILRVENLTIKSNGSFGKRYVLLDGTLELKAYRYRGSQADNLSNGDEGSKPKESKEPGT